MTEFIQLIDTIGTHLTAANIEQFIALVEELITLAESMKVPGASPASSTSVK